MDDLDVLSVTDSCGSDSDCDSFKAWGCWAPSVGPLIGGVGVPEHQMLFLGSED